MRREWVISVVISLIVLILIAVLWTPVGAMLGGLVLMSAVSLAIIGSHVVLVRERTALVVCSSLHDAVIRVVPGPDRTFLLPFVEKPGPVLDTSYHLVPVYVDNILQSEQRPSALGFTANVLYQLAPHLIPPSQLGQILPSLTDNAEGIVRRYCDYYLRNLVAERHPEQMTNGNRSRLERHLLQLMAGHLVRLGIVIQTVELVIRPATGLHHTLTAAEQKRIGIMLQREQLEAILGALTDRSEEAQSLARLELARALGQGGQTWTTLDIASALGVDPDLTPSPARLRPPQWAGAMKLPSDAEKTRLPPI